MQRGIKAGVTMPKRGRIVEAKLVRKGIIAGTAMPSADIEARTNTPRGAKIIVDATCTDEGETSKTRSRETRSR
jgi:hypothetical protein